jgi:hypothetical protein
MANKQPPVSAYALLILKKLVRHLEEARVVMELDGDRISQAIMASGKDSTALRLLCSGNMQRPGGLVAEMHEQLEAVAEALGIATADTGQGPAPSTPARQHNEEATPAPAATPPAASTPAATPPATQPATPSPTKARRKRSPA